MDGWVAPPAGTPTAHRRPLSPSIRSYFGEKIALYFAFLGSYTHYLLGPAAVGVAAAVDVYFVTGAVDSVTAPAFALFMSVWSTLFLEAWKRRNAVLQVRPRPSAHVPSGHTNGKGAHCSPFQHTLTPFRRALVR